MVAAASASRAQFPITLDQAVERRVEQAGVAVMAISPKAFLQTVLPRHRDFAKIRQQG